MGNIKTNSGGAGGVPPVKHEVQALKNIRQTPSTVGDSITTKDTYPTAANAQSAMNQNIQKAITTNGFINGGHRGGGGSGAVLYKPGPNHTITEQTLDQFGNTNFNETNSGIPDSVVKSYIKK
jgi:hypothetical protein